MIIDMNFNLFYKDPNQNIIDPSLRLLQSAKQEGVAVYKTN